MFAALPTSRQPPKSSPIMDRVVSPVPPQHIPQRASHHKTLYYDPIPLEVPRKLEPQFHTSFQADADSKAQVHAPPRVAAPYEPIAASIAASQSLRANVSHIAPPGSIAHGDRPSRKPRSLPDNVPLPTLQPVVGGRSLGLEATSTTAIAAQCPPPTQPVVSSPPPHHEVPIATATTATATGSERDAASITATGTATIINQNTERDREVWDSISVVVKGLSTSLNCSPPAPRVLELSLSANGSSSPTVAEVISQALTLLGRNEDSRFIVEERLVVESATLEQHGVPLESHLRLAEIGQLGELFFLCVVYTPLPVISTQKILVSPDPPKPQPSAFSGIDDDRLQHIELRLAAVESFVRAASSPRDDGPVAHASPPRPVPESSDATAVSLLRSDAMLSAIVSSTPSPQRRHDVVKVTPDVRPTAALQNPEDTDIVSYGARAERIAFLALRSRQERLQKIQEMRRWIENQTSLCAWMEAQVEQEGSVVIQKDMGATVAVSGASLDERPRRRAPAAAQPPVTSETGLDGVRVDYDPVLDVWRLRKVHH